MNNRAVTQNEMQQVGDAITAILEKHAGAIFTELNIELLKIFENEVPIKLLAFSYYRMLTGLQEGAINFFTKQTGVEQKSINAAFREWSMFEHNSNTAPTSALQ